ncbi:MAG: HEAT repeat domain-containing protein, partial [Planctomycetaceae bacterium]
MGTEQQAPQQLVETLRNDNMLWRLHAQRLLVERGQLDVLPALIELVEDRSMDEIGLNVGAIHALWTLHGLGALDGTHPEATAAVVKTLHHPSAGVQRNALLVLPRTKDSIRPLLDSGILLTDDPQVQLAALLTLSEMPADKSLGRAIAAELTIPPTINDRWLSDAITAAAAAHDLHVLRTVAEDGRNFRPPAREILGRVAEHYARGGPADSVNSLLELLPKADRRNAAAILLGLSRGWPKDKRVELSDAAEQALVDLMPTLSTEGRAGVLMLAAAWHSERFAKAIDQLAAELLKSAANDSESAEDRVNSARLLIRFRPDDDRVVNDLLEAVTPGTPTRVAAGIFDALEQSRSAAVGPAIVERLGALTP